VGSAPAPAIAGGAPVAAAARADAAGDASASARAVAAPNGDADVRGEPRVSHDHPTGQQAVDQQSKTGQYSDAKTPIALVHKKPPPLPHRNLVRRPAASPGDEPDAPPRGAANKSED